MSSYRTVCFVAVMAICGFIVGCGGDAPAPAVDSAPSVTEPVAAGSDTKPEAAEPTSTEAEPAGSGSR